MKVTNFVIPQEGDKLESTLGALNIGQSPAQFKAQLEKIKNSINTWNAVVNLENGIISNNVVIKGDGTVYTNNSDGTFTRIR